MDRGAWQAIVQGVAKSWTWLSEWRFHFYCKGILAPNRSLRILQWLVFDLWYKSLLATTHRLDMIFLNWCCHSVESQHHPGSILSHCFLFEERKRLSDSLIFIKVGKLDLDLRIEILITPGKFWLSFFLSQASLLQALQEAQKIWSVLPALIQRWAGEQDNAFSYCSWGLYG